MSENDKPEFPVEGGPINIVDEDDAHLAQLGHAPQLHRQYGLWSVIALGVLGTNTWSALGGTFIAGIFSGGSTMVLYGFIVVAFANVFVLLSMAELASSYPTSGGAYHWAAAIASPKWSKIASFTTGWLNVLGWIIGTAGSSLVLAQFVLGICSLALPDLVIERWMIFVAYQGWTLLATLNSIYGNALMPHVIRFAMFWTLAGCFVTIVVLLTVSDFKQSATEVFTSFDNETGWSSDVFAVLVGLINPAFGFAAIDVTIHFAEEVKDPERNVPLSLIAVLVLGFVSGFAFLLAVFFTVEDYGPLLASATGLPVVELYKQACGPAGGMALTVILFIATIPALLDCDIATGRLVWAFARDNGMPFSNTFKKVNPKTGVPIQATILANAGIALLGCIYIGNTTAFSAFLSSAMVLNYLTYVIPVAINMFDGRRNFRRGKFFLPGFWGWFINGGMCLWIAFTVIVFEFPGFYPVTPANMNYTSLLLGASLIFIAIYWWAAGKTSYTGPIVAIALNAGPEDQQAVDEALNQVGVANTEFLTTDKLEKV